MKQRKRRRRKKRKRKEKEQKAKCTGAGGWETDSVQGFSLRLSVLIRRGKCVFHGFLWNLNVPGIK